MASAGFATRRKPRHEPAATLPYLEAWQAQMEAEAQASTAAAEVAAKAAIARGPATALQQELVEEEARSRWAERMQAHLQGVKAAEEVRASGSHQTSLVARAEAARAPATGEPRVSTHQEALQDPRCVRESRPVEEVRRASCQGDRGGARRRAGFGGRGGWYGSRWRVSGARGAAGGARRRCRRRCSSCLRLLRRRRLLFFRGWAGRGGKRRVEP